jgi:hypothetical protein
MPTEPPKPPKRLEDLDLPPNMYRMTLEDLDRLGIPRSHSVISPGFGNKSKTPPEPETKDSQTGQEPPKSS